MIDRETVATIVFNIVGIIGIIAMIILMAKCSNNKDVLAWNNGYCECGGRMSYKGVQANVINAIKQGTPYNAERPQGEWIFDKEFTEFGNPYGTYRCSVCGCHSSNKYSFCKDCGADMRKRCAE